MNGTGWGETCPLTAVSTSFKQGKKEKKSYLLRKKHGEQPVSRHDNEGCQSCGCGTTRRGKRGLFPLFHRVSEADKLLRGGNERAGSRTGGNRRGPSSPSQIVSLLLSLRNRSRVLQAPGPSPSPGGYHTATGRTKRGAHPSAHEWDDETQRGKAPASAGACQDVDSTTALSGRDGAGLSVPKRGRKFFSFASRPKGKSQNPGLKCQRISKLGPIYSSEL